MIPHSFAESNDTWWDLNWNYRTKIEINSTQYSRTDWPVEIEMNFTNSLDGTFDNNSIRVMEYDRHFIMQEVPSQFEASESYDASLDSSGTVSFIMNGTTPANASRKFYVYFDKTENDQKPFIFYNTNLTYGWDGSIFAINNSFLVSLIDTNRGDNSSGFSRIEDKFGNVIATANSGDRTVEYNEYFNGTHELTYDLRNNISVFNGSVSVVIKQGGDEVIFNNNSDKTNETRILKEYIVYNKAGPEQFGTFIKMKQTITNTAPYAVTRNSTAAGGLAFDMDRTFGSALGIEDFLGDSSEPYSYFEAGSSIFVVGIVNLNSSVNYFAANTSLRIGMQANNITLQPNSSITQTSLVYFGTAGSDSTAEFLDIRNRFVTPLTISQFASESWTVISNVTTNATIYNRNETVFITANLTEGDPLNLTVLVNATFDMGTAGSGDDVTIELFDDGNHSDASSLDRVFGNLFNITTADSTGLWTVNISMYNETDFLNSTIVTFNVTDQYNVTIIILNPTGALNRTVFGDVQLKNFRYDTWIPKANVSCIFGSTNVDNITDMNNGTYSFNFTAPETIGSFTLFCNATKSGNIGNATSIFTTETPTTNISLILDSIVVNVSGIGLFDNSSFTAIANATNIGNGTAFNVNITTELLFGWVSNISLINCNNIQPGNSCIHPFNITVPNGTSPGNYTVNFTILWTNLDNTPSLNRTPLNVSVKENPKVDVLESLVSVLGADGGNIYVGNFTILSVGNVPAQNITFSCFEGSVCQNFTITFEPLNVSSILVGSNISIKINATIPLNFSPGSYNGNVNVTSNLTFLRYDTFILQINTSETTATSIAFDPPDYTASNVGINSNETFLLATNVTNIGFGSARFVNISLILLSGWAANTTFYTCPNITKDETCSQNFNITVPNGTSPGNYLINLSVAWTENNNSIGTNISSFLVIVSSNYAIDIVPEVITGNVTVNSTEFFNFTVFSVGSSGLENINFTCISGLVCQNFTVTFNPLNISSLNVSRNSTVSASISVPENFPAGTYNGSVNVSAANNTFSIFLFNITVPSSRLWTLSPSLCQKNTFPEEGTACTITITNLGNQFINFTITPQSANHSSVNETNFTINVGRNHSFSVLYNVVNVTPAVYNSTYTVSPVQVASPQNLNFNISLLPSTPPLVNITISPNFTVQNSNVKIFLNITERSGTGINSVTINITLPNSTVDSLVPVLTGQDGNVTRWFLLYPNNTRNLTLTGFHNVSVFAIDNIGNTIETVSNFTVMKNVTIIGKTLATEYVQGETGSVFYSARNISNSGVGNINTTLKIRDANGILILNATGITDNDGAIVPLPTFSLTSDAVVGNYTLNITSTFFDETVNITRVENNITIFPVKEKTVTVTGLSANIETTVEWFPNNIMRFGILVTNGEGLPVDPTDSILKVFDPALNPYFTATLNDFVKQGTGFYTYDFAMPVSTAAGMYLAMFNATQNDLKTTKLTAFRVTQGGPFDFRTNLLENEVPIGDYLDFTLVVENKGSVSQDVLIEYWISDLTGATTYFSTSEFVLAPAFFNQTFSRNAFIFSNQSLGLYLLNARMTFSVVQPSLQVNTTFSVVESLAATPTPTPSTVSGPSAGGGEPITGFLAEPTPEPVAAILIEKYNSNISLARGMTRIESVTLKNIGKTNLNNMTLLLVGVPLSWYNITPIGYAITEPDKSYTFLVEFHIPKDVNAGQYTGNLVASSNRATDQKSILLTIYESIEDVIKIEIQNLEEQFQEIIIDSKVAEREGKDVTAIKLLIEEIKEQISLAKKNLDAGKTEEALVNIGNGKNLIERTRRLLDGLEKPVAPAAEFPFLLILGIVVLIILIVLSVYLYLKKTKKTVKIFQIPYVSGLIKLVKGKEVSKDVLLREHDKLSRMLHILEKERTEGIISEKAYDEMKKSLKVKIYKMGKKISSGKKETNPQ
jgi:uncharacterized membrane protein